MDPGGCQKSPVFFYIFGKSPVFIFFTAAESTVKKPGPESYRAAAAAVRSQVEASTGTVYDSGPGFFTVP